ncbi:5'-nucleotidase C-terminal domain-containing protein [Sphingobacterium sp. lm-10]|uniref:5'-nucleotidase C-terminal domain-containing protein n=1 Tax=Sphingobacterium sp. lm-10 TaxID=2944904 RepID=UPI00201FDC81|nr:5'-nucleotidase [Sphingobacterium sp. lm-10]MCL7986791.1 5'-nucleotidase C-terminal domain-containing protein [Sphingobacterium sp. lm-10]
MTYFSFRIFVPYGMSLLLALSACKTAHWQKNNYEPTKFAIDQQIEPDSSITNYIAPYKQRLQAQMDTVIGQAAQMLPRSPTDGQSLGGNFFADALLALGQGLDPEVSCSLGTKYGIRVDIAQGDIQVGKVFELMPFENFLTVLTLKGEDLLTLGKFIAKSNGQPVAGMSIKIKNQQLVEMKIQGKAVESNKIYKLVTYDYLANGGDNIVGISSPLNRVDTPTRVREGLIAYIESLTKQGIQVNAERDERIIIVQ